MAGERAQALAELMIEGLELLAAARLEALAIGNIEEQLAGWVEPANVARVGLEDAHRDAGFAQVGLCRCDRFGIAIGRENGRRLDDAPLQLGA